MHSRCYGNLRHEAVRNVDANEADRHVQIRVGDLPLLRG